MGKYGRLDNVQVFYYYPNSQYCAVVARTITEVDQIKRVILCHYLGEDPQFKEKVIIRAKSRKPAGKVIHVTRGNIAELLRNEQSYQGIAIMESSENLKDPNQAKASLRRLINRHS